MARQTMPLDEFLEKTVAAAFDLCGGLFAPVAADQRQKSLLSITTSLKGTVPKRFLHFLETSEDPKKVVEDALEDIANSPHEYPLYSIPGKFTKEGFLEDVAIHTVQHIMLAVFGPPMEHNLKFTADVNDIYAFLKQKTEEAMTNDGADTPNGFDSTHIDLREEEKKELIQKYANSSFSIHVFIRKISKETNTGQYL